MKTTPQLEVLKTTPQQLFNAYENNEVAADNWLKGKIIEITGVVQSIDKSILENIFVSLATKNEFLPAKIHYGSGISSQEETKIAALRRGQTVVFRCRKMHRWVGSPMGEDCVLMSAY